MAFVMLTCVQRYANYMISKKFLEHTHFFSISTKNIFKLKVKVKSICDIDSGSGVCFTFAAANNLSKANMVHLLKKKKNKNIFLGSKHILRKHIKSC